MIREHLFASGNFECDCHGGVLGNGLISALCACVYSQPNFHSSSSRPETTGRYYCMAKQAGLDELRKPLIAYPFIVLVLPGPGNNPVAERYLFDQQHNFDDLFFYR